MESTKCQKIRDAVKRHPYLIPTLLKDKSYDPIITKAIIKSMLPTRVGIEIECIGNLNISKFKELPYNNKRNNIFNRYKKIEDHYNIYDFKQDYFNTDPNISMINEHNISLLNYNHLLGLYNILNDMKKHCFINPKSGIHIHINASKLLSDNLMNYIYNEYKNNINLSYNILNNEFNKHLDTIDDIFDNSYTGLYNKRGIQLDIKTHWVNIRSNLRSIEFRIGYCTFDYETIIRWCIELTKLVNKVTNNILESKKFKALNI